MKNLKKVLALVVALTMVFTTVAFASYPDVDTEADCYGAVELLSALEVLQGDENGNFNPDNTITRAEFAAVVCRALGLEGSAASAKGATMFTDVAADHWASGYINLASQQGIVNGKGNGIFDPEGNVTYAEAVKMLVVAIGYEPMAATKGGYPAGYLSVANSQKMTAGVSGSSDVAALRSTVAMLTANAIEIPVMDQTAYGSETKFEPLDDYDNYTTLLTQLDVYKVTGIIKDVDLVEGEFTIDITEESEDYSFGWKNAYDTTAFPLEKTFDIGESNVAAYAKESVDVYLLKEGRDNYTAVIAVPSGIGEILTINASDLDVSFNDAGALTDYANAKIGTDKWEYFETVDADKATKIYVSKTPMIVVNNNSVKLDEVSADFVANFANKDAAIKFIENNDDKYYDIIDITVYEHAIVDEVETARNRINFMNSTNVKFDADNEEQIVKIYNAEGAEIALEDIQEGDVLAMVVCDDLNSSNLPKRASNFNEEIIIYNLGASSVTGVLNQEGDEEIYIDGVPYEYVDEFVSEKEYDDLFKATGAKLGTEGTFYLGITGKIIGFAGVEGSIDNYAFILQGALSDSTWDKCYELKVLQADGSIKTYKIDDEVTVIEGADEDEVEFADQGTYFDVPEFGADDDDVYVYKRVIDFKANSKDQITEITYVYKDSKGNDDYAEVTTTKSYNEDTAKVDGKLLASDVIIFNVDVTDADDAVVEGLDVLVDESTYEGYVLVKDDEYGIFVMTSGAVKFDEEAHIFVVDSVVATTYGDDREEATKVTYYVDGSETAEAIFVDGESETEGSVKFDKLAKGSIFVAATAADGLVSRYEVIANVNAAGTGYDSIADVTDVYGDDTDAEFVGGYITDIRNNRYVGIADYADGEVTVKAASAQYYYNTASKKAKIEAGDWYGDDIDNADETGANYVFVKLYDGNVVDIITFSARVIAE